MQDLVHGPGLGFSLVGSQYVPQALYVSWNRQKGRFVVVVGTVVGATVAARVCMMRYPMKLHRKTAASVTRIAD